MIRKGSTVRRWTSTAAALAIFAMVAVTACSSDDNSGGPTPDGGTRADSSSDGTGSSSSGSGSSSGSTAQEAGNDAAPDVSVSDASPTDAAVHDAGPYTPSTCASPGAATVGPADNHCALPDGGFTVQSTNPASCYYDGGVPGDDGGDSCDYNNTNYGSTADDDDCKYHVTWTSSPICSGGPGVVFTVVATLRTADGSPGAPLVGANTKIEAFTTTPGDWDSASYCDDMSTHPSPSPGFPGTIENPPGTYTGQVIFDQSGQWTVRFHFHEECADVLDDSPHGHAAFHITVP
jgi:hypothetical protein